MTVKEIFDLRKQGKIEEAYDAIRPMYAAHKGRYTTLCMFWTASDVLKLRLQQGRTEEASKIYEALKRMLPRVEEITKELDKQRDRKGAASSTAETKDVVAKELDAKLPWENNKPQHSGSSASAFLQYAAHRLASIVPAGSPASLALTGSPSSLALSGSPTAAVPAGSLACPVLSGSPAEGLNPGQQAVLDCIKAHPGLKVPGIEAETGIPAKSIERHIKVLIARNLIEHRGSKKTGGYYAK